MFDAIGRGGRTKKLSPYRWIASLGLSFVLGGVVWVVTDVIQHVPTAKAAKEEEGPVEVKFSKTPPPPPPPPPGPPPKSTTRPLKNQITKKVVKKEIKTPDPTPIPPKEEKEKPPTPEPQEDSGAAAGGVAGGVVGGVLGGVLGGVVGGTGPSQGEIKSVEENARAYINKDEVKEIFKSNIPALARRAGINLDAMVEVTVGQDGRVMNVVWISGNELFRDAVMAAIRAARYEPGPTAFKMRQGFRFIMK